MGRRRQALARVVARWVPGAGQVTIGTVGAIVAQLIGIRDPVMAAKFALVIGTVSVVFRESVGPRVSAFVQHLGGPEAAADAAARNPEAFQQVLRKMLDADPKVVPALSRLVDEYTRDPPKRVDSEFRAIVALLTELSAEDYDALVELVARALASMQPNQEDIAFRAGRKKGAAQVQFARFRMTWIGGEAHDLPFAERVASLLRTHGLVEERPDIHRDLSPDDDHISTYLPSVSEQLGEWSTYSVIARSRLERLSVLVS